MSFEPLSFPPNPFPSTTLGTVLIVGGTGSLGSSIAHHLLTSPHRLTTSTIHILSRSPPRPFIKALLKGVTYHHFSLADETAFRALLVEIKPTVIFHTSSPRYDGSAKEQHLVNVVGTSVLLQCAAEAQSVKALVYSSTESVLQQLRLSEGETSVTEETARVVDPEARDTTAYARTKLLAERLVLQANGPALKTAAMRFGGLYGDGDYWYIPSALDMLKKGQQKMQIGDNSTPREYVYLHSCAYAHILAAQGLLHGSGVDGGPVAGEIFNVSDGAIKFWDFQRMIWRAAGDTTPLDKVTILPQWFITAVVRGTEWFYWVFTAGTRRPEMKWDGVKYLFWPSGLDCKKVRGRLGWKPLLGREEGVRRGVEWWLREEKKRVN